MVGIIDFNAGNITSLERALDYLKIPYIRSKNPSELKDCDRFMFPGDGDDAYAMAELKKSGFDVFVREQVQAGKLLFGICVGSQIIFEHSEEGNASRHRQNGCSDEHEAYRFCVGLVHLDVSVVSGKEHQEYESQLIEDV